jgi:superfamily II RNA helicase
LKNELKVCNSLLKNDTNEKANDFDSKNKVLMEYNFIDKDQNILYKGKVARLVSSQDPILLT